ncbi:VOC family protein [Sphingomonas oleivorans]|uniref:VOC family protein n=1 Tax=Sphingomonas oleivorans TaxID=1735121 RepID=UPI001A9EF9F3|nr:VOC family protein [Sphingomonas oleivorans]
MIALPQLRVARPTDDLEAVIRFYRDGPGLEELSRFENPDGYRILLQNAAWPT